LFLSLGKYLVLLGQMEQMELSLAGNSLLLMRQENYLLAQ